MILIKDEHEIKRMQKYILKVLKELNNTKQNVLISPYCFEVLLGIVTEGTRGETKKGFLKLLEGEDDNYSRLVQNNKSLLTVNKNTTITQTNTITHNSELTVVPSFSEKISKDFDLKVIHNEYIGGNNSFIIKSIFNINGSWLQLFHDIPSNGEYFTLENGDQKEALFISQSNTYGGNKTKYLREETYHAVQIPLKDENLCVEIYLPYENDGIKGFIESLDVAALRANTNLFQEVESMEVLLPKFKMEIEFSLKDYKELLGIEKLFKQTWDFDTLFNCDQTIGVTDITQKNIFELSKDGIEATSISKLIGIAGGLPELKKYVLFEATHPFMYLVRDKISESILFMGTLDEPVDVESIAFAHYNSRQLSKFRENPETTFDKLDLVFAVFTLEVLIKYFNIKNRFAIWCVDQIWKAIEATEDQIYNENIKKIAELDLFQEKLKTEDIELLNSFKQFLQDGPEQLISVLHIIQEKCSYDNFPMRNFCSNNCLDILKNMNLQFPEYNVFLELYKNLNKDANGKISRKPPEYFLLDTIPKVELTKEELLSGKKARIVRGLQPILLDVSVRGLLYFGLVSLNVLIKKHLYNVIELKKWFLELIKVVSIEKDIERVKAKDLNFGIDEQTGFFNGSKNISKSDYSAIQQKYPKITTILEAICGLIDRLENGPGHYDPNWTLIFHTNKIIEELMDNEIDIADVFEFEKYVLTNTDEKDDVLIPIEEKLVSELLV